MNKFALYIPRYSKYVGRSENDWTGGYPYLVDDIWEASLWNTKDEALSHLTKFKQVIPKTLAIEVGLNPIGLHDFDLARAQLIDQGYLLVAKGKDYIQEDAPDDLVKRYRAES